MDNTASPTEPAAITSLADQDDVALAEQLRERYQQTRAELGKLIIGQHEAVDLVLLTLLVVAGCDKKPADEPKKETQEKPKEVTKAPTPAPTLPP